MGANSDVRGQILGRNSSQLQQDMQGFNLSKDYYSDKRSIRSDNPESLLTKASPNFVFSKMKSFRIIPRPFERVVFAYYDIEVPPRTSFERVLFLIKRTCTCQLHYACTMPVLCLYYACTLLLFPSPLSHQSFLVKFAQIKLPWLPGFT